jgi:ATP-binding protein involved in chromosome partitioning
MSNPFDQKRPIDGIKKIILVASGKGGVGKSTVAANIAVSLKNLGQKVGLLDCDIHGPSVPRLFGAINQKPIVTNENKILPVERLGIKLMSIGFLVEETAAVVWRGPMLFKALDQFFRDVQWGELDTLVLDLPPGTGDVQLSIAQKVPVEGAVVVTTPQNMALADVIKSIDMFNTVKIPILGVVENMSYLRTENGPVELFPKGDLRQFLDSKGLKLLGEVPFHATVAKGSEIGLPVSETHKEAPEALVFKTVAQSLI